MTIPDDFAQRLQGDERPADIAQILVEVLVGRYPDSEVTCFLKDDEGYTVSASSRDDVANIVFPAHCLTTSLLRDTLLSLDLQHLVQDTTSTMAQDERDIHTHLGASFLIPIRLGAEMPSFLGISMSRGQPVIDAIISELKPLTVLAGLVLQLSRYRKQNEEDMLAAWEIQQRFLPRDKPSVRHLDYDAVFLPARTVSGDYYEFVRFTDERFAFAVGDVAGKGISAALIMANIKTSLRKAIVSNQDRLAEWMDELHSIVCRLSEDRCDVVLGYTTPKIATPVC
jgi:hypothetical protein